MMSVNNGIFFYLSVPDEAEAAKHPAFTTDVIRIEKST